MKVVLLANTDWFLYRFNAALARRLRDGGADVVLVSPAGEYSRRFEAEGFQWRHWPIERRRLRPWQEWTTCRRLATILRRERPRLVHCFTLKAALYGSAMARLSRLPHVVCSITGLGYLYASGRLDARLLRRLMETCGRRLFPANELIFLNADDRDTFRARGLVADDSGTVIGSSGVDVETFTPQAWDEPGPPWVVLPTRPLLSKGIEIFMTAAEILRRRGVEARFAIVGDVDDDNPDALPAADLQARCARSGVEHWGFQDDMVVVYRRAGIVCLPSFYREGVPTVLLEAAACERPVVTTDMPGCRDAVRDGETGRVVPPRDAEALAEALAALIEDPATCRAMGRAGRRRVLEQFSVERVVQATLDVYRRLGCQLPKEKSVHPMDMDIEPRAHLRDDARQHISRTRPDAAMSGHDPSQPRKERSP